MYNLHILTCTLCYIVFFQNNLTQSQDKALRRISEMKEVPCRTCTQCTLFFRFMHLKISLNQKAKIEYSDCHKHRTKKNSESQSGMEPMTSHTDTSLSSNHQAKIKPGKYMYDLPRHESPSSSVVRAPNPCMGGLGFDSCLGHMSAFFLSHACDKLSISLFLISF